MASYDLTGTGVQALTPATARLFIAVVQTTVFEHVGRANPTNFYDRGLLRLGVGDYYYPAQPLDGDQVVLDLGSGVTNLGYALFDVVEITVSEDAPLTPPGTTVSTNLDGGSCTEGDAVTITWSRSDTPDVNDYVGIVDTGWNTGFGRAFGYLTTTNFPYTSSGTVTPGGTGVASGTYSDNIHNVFGGSHVLLAVYVDGATNTVIASGTTFTIS